MSTVANVNRSEGSHWYYPDGRPCYELPKADGKGMKSPTLADARKLNLFPGVSTILKVLHKEALVNWLVEQAVLAVLTTPRAIIATADPKTGKVTERKETDDEFTKRVLSEDRVQDQESQIARDRGTEIHNALDSLCKGEAVSDEMAPWIAPAFNAVAKYGTILSTEVSIVGEGYGGRIDILQHNPELIWVWDWKTSKKLPDPKKGGAYKEHQLQLAAYAKAVQLDIWKKTSKTPKIRTGNVYISTVTTGEFVICEHEDTKENNWLRTFDMGFRPLVAHWQWANNYRPQSELIA